MPPSDPDISLRKQPRQGRSTATVEAILEAAARILEDSGAGPLTTNLVAQRAGVSVGSLYQYFPSKEAILAELVRRIRAEMLTDMTRAAQSVAHLPLRDQIAPMVRASVAHHQRRPALAVALERLETELPLEQDTAALKSQIESLLVTLLAQHEVQDPQIAAFDLAAMTAGVANAAAREGTTEFDPVVARIARAVRGYLGV